MYLPVGKEASGARVPTITNLGITVGVLPFTRLNVEVGLDHKSGLGLLDDYPLYGNAKMGMPESALGRFWPAVAVGIFDVGTKNDATDYNVSLWKDGQDLFSRRRFPRTSFDRLFFRKWGFAGR